MVGIVWYGTELHGCVEKSSPIEPLTPSEFAGGLAIRLAVDLWRRLAAVLGESFGVHRWAWLWRVVL